MFDLAIQLREVQVYVPFARSFCLRVKFVTHELLDGDGRLKFQTRPVDNWLGPLRCW
jgi:hypothetical protein